MDQPELTVVIPHWNRRELLRHCLRSLEGQTVPCRVFVVDNGSQDGSVEMVRKHFPTVTCLELERNWGFACAANQGIAACTTPYLALLNNDTEAQSTWVEAGLRAFRTFPKCSFFASKMIDFFQRDRLDSAGDCYSRSGLPTKRGAGNPCEWYAHSVPVLGASAGAAFYRRDLFDQIGLLDESYYMYLEDVDLSLRAQLAGFQCRYLPDAVVYHVEAASDPHRAADSGGRSARSRIFYSSDRVFWITRNRWQLMITYQPLRNWPWLVWGWSKSVLFHAFKAGYLWAFLRGLWAGVQLTSRAFRKRKELRQTRTLSTSGLCQLLRKS